MEAIILTTILAGLGAAVCFAYVIVKLPKILTAE
jgi:hypothetical protein